MVNAERFKPLLVILVWFLLMQLLVLYYNIMTRTFTFEFYVTLLLTAVNLGAIVFLVRAAAKEFKKEYERLQSLYRNRDEEQG